MQTLNQPLTLTKVSDAPVVETTEFEVWYRDAQTRAYGPLEETVGGILVTKTFTGEFAELDAKKVASDLEALGHLDVAVFH